MTSALLLLPTCVSALVVAGNAPRAVLHHSSHSLLHYTPRVPAIVMEKSVIGFAKDRAPGLAIAGTIGYVAELTASRIPVALSPLLYATAFGSERLLPAPTDTMRKSPCPWSTHGRGILAAHPTLGMLRVFAVAIGNVLRLFDPQMKQLQGTAVGMKFAKQRLLRAGIILVRSRVHVQADPHHGTTICSARANPHHGTPMPRAALDSCPRPIAVRRQDHLWQDSGHRPRRTSDRSVRAPGSDRPPQLPHPVGSP